MKHCWVCGPGTVETVETVTRVEGLEEGVRESVTVYHCPNGCPPSSMVMTVRKEPAGGYGQ